MIKIGRHINGIMLNYLEYILNEDGNIKRFKNKTNALKWLKEKGATEEEIHYLVFKRA